MKLVAWPSLISIGLAGMLLAGTASAQSKIARTPDGKPDLNGVWQALNEAHWDLQAHAFRTSPKRPSSARRTRRSGSSSIRS